MLELANTYLNALHFFKKRVDLRFRVRKILSASNPVPYPSQYKAWPGSNSKRPCTFGVLENRGSNKTIQSIG